MGRSVRAGVRAIAAWGFALVASLAAMPAMAEDVPVSENASRHFAEGVRHLTSEAPDRFHRAYRAFQAAYADSPTWKILGNLGIVAHELERDGEAIDAFSKYLEEGGKRIPKEERTQVQRDLELLGSLHATLQLDVGPVGAWIVDERLPESGAPVVNRYGPAKGPVTLKVRAGHHRVRAERDGYVDSRWEVLLEPRDVREHSFVLEEIEPEAPAGGSGVEGLDAVDPATGAADEGGSGARVGAFVALGLAGVGAGVGGWFLYEAGQSASVANSLYADCIRNNTPEQGNTCQPTSPFSESALRADQEERRNRKASLVAFSAGGAALLVGGILLLVSSGDDDDDELGLIPFVGPDSVGVRGVF